MEMLPGDNSEETDDSQQEAQREAGNELPSEYSEPITQFQFAQCQGTDNQGSRLRTGITPTADDEGNEQRKDDSTCDLCFKESQSDGIENSSLRGWCSA
jgi:hypothetical protein